MKGASSALVLAALLCACVLLGGCTSLLSRAAARHEAVPAGPAAYEIEIEAPDALRTLLMTHLDLARFRASAVASELSNSELDRLVAAAPVHARALLETEGYFNADVTAAREAGTPPLVRVRVEPGPRATIAALDIKVEGDLQDRADAGDDLARQTLKEWRAAWALKPGQPFRQAAWAEAKNASIARLRAQGYAAAQWDNTAAQVDARSNQVRLSLRADSGPLFLSGPLLIRGLRRHDEDAVRNLAGFDPGTPVTEKLLLDYQERLQKLGLFDRVIVEFDPDREKAAATPINVRLHEQSLQQSTVGVGYSANTGQRASVEHTHRRPFGQDVVLHNHVELGRDRQAWEGELSSHPQKGFYRNLLAGTLERLQSSGETRRSSQLRIGRTQDTQEVERLLFVQVENTSLLSDNVDQRAQAVSANYHGVWRRLDNVLLPTEGFTVALQGGVGRAHSNYAATGYYTRAWGRLTAYEPLGKSWLGQARLEVGHIFAADNMGLPDTQLFRAGGDNSVRGYAYRTLGPVVNGAVVGGRVVLTASAEAARPIVASMPSLLGAVFIDAGNAATGWKDLTLARGYGAGLRWRSPVGPLRFDVAYGERTQKWRMHFSIGIAF